MKATRAAVAVLALLALLALVVVPLIPYASATSRLTPGIVLSSVEGETLYTYKIEPVNPDTVARVVLRLVSNESDSLHGATRRTIWVNGSAFYVYRGSTELANYTLIVSGYGDFLLNARARPGVALTCPTPEDMEEAFEPLLEARARIVLPPESIIVAAVTPLHSACEGGNCTGEITPIGENRTFIVEVDGVPLVPRTHVECSERGDEGYERLIAKGFIPPIQQATAAEVNLTGTLVAEIARTAASHGLPGDPGKLIVQSICLAGEDGLLAPRIVLAAPGSGARVLEVALGQDGIVAVAEGGLDDLRYDCLPHSRVDWVKVQGAAYASTSVGGGEWKYSSFEVAFMGALAATVVAVLVVLARRL